MLLLVEKEEEGWERRKDERMLDDMWKESNLQMKKVSVKVLCWKDSEGWRDWQSWTDIFSVFSSDWRNRPSRLNPLANHR